MNVKLKNTQQESIDPDDAPEISAADLQRGVWSVEGKIVPETEGR